MNPSKNSAGYKRFEYYFIKLQALLTQASKQKNPALWLYTIDTRTYLFMLEGLAKIYAGIHNKKKFDKIREQVKLFEDVLGAVDYYDVMAKDLAKNKKIPGEAIHYLQAQTREKIQSLNELLTEKEWLSAKKNRIEKIKKKLIKVDWLPDREEINEFAIFYGKSIYRIIEWIQEKKYSFTNLETELHELRRKLRWLSIYPQALQGCIQLIETKNSRRYLKKYLTKEIVNSAFNKMPDAGDTKQFLMLEKNIYYSLSWMIAELGELKDTGLRIIALEEALQQTSGLKDGAAFERLYQLRAIKKESVPDLLNKAAAISAIYFKEHNLENLVLGIGKMK